MDTGYDARAVRITQLRSVINYVKTQSTHHPDRAIQGESAL